MAIGIARVFTSCWRHKVRREVEHGCGVGVGKKGVQDWHRASPGGQVEPGQDSGSSEGPSLGGPSASIILSRLLSTRYWTPALTTLSLRNRRRQMFLLCPFPGEELRPTDSHVLTQQEGLVEFGSCDSRGRVQTTSTAARIFRAGAPGGVGGRGGGQREFR